MAAETFLSSQIGRIYSEKLVRPKVQLLSLLKDAGADKDVLTIKEVMFYLGKYIMSKELYNKQQQHIVHCGNDALGAVFGVTSFSIKEPRAVFAMIFKNLIAVENPESQSSFSEPGSGTDPDRGTQDYWKCSRCSELNPPLKPSVPPCDPDEGAERSRLSAASRDESTAAAAATPFDSWGWSPLSSRPSASSSRVHGQEDAHAPCWEPCVICCSRSKNGCIVHGGTGHLVSCYTCARKLQRRNQPCPVCRKPIQSVLLTYMC